MISDIFGVYCGGLISIRTESVYLGYIGTLRGVELGYLELLEHICTSTIQISKNRVRPVKADLGYLYFNNTK